MVRVFAAAPRRWKAVVAGVFLLLVAAAAGGYGYAVREWRAAVQAVAARRPDEAHRHLRVCLWVWSNSPEVHLLAARADRMAGDFTAAERQLNRCKQLEGSATEAIQLEFLLIRAQTGDVEQVAPALFDLVEKGHPETPMILETVASSYMHTLQYGPAYACLSRWIMATPDAAKPFQWRGWVQERLNNTKGAAEDYKRSLELDPDLVPARLRLAELLIAEHNPVDAVPHLERLIRQEPDRADVKARLGQCRFLEGRTEEARRLMTEAVAQLPDDAALLVTLARLDLQDGHAAEAEKWIRRELATDPTDSEARFILVGALRAQGRAAEADAEQVRHDQNQEMLVRIHKLLKTEADGKADPDTLYELGSLFLQSGQENLAVHWLNQAIERNPYHQLAHRALAEFYDKKGLPDKAAYHRGRLR